MSRRKSCLLFIGIAALGAFFMSKKISAADDFSLGEKYRVAFAQENNSALFTFFDTFTDAAGKSARFDLAVPADRYAGHQFSDNTLTVDLSDGGSVSIRPLKVDSPFLHVEWKRLDSAALEAKKLPPREDKTFRSIEFPPFILRGETFKTLSTAGLKSADEPVGSYAFFAAADPENNHGAVAGWLTSHHGSGIFLAEPGNEKNRSGVKLTPRLDYGRLSLTAADDFTSEAMIIGYFDDARDGLEAYADETAAANNVKIKPPMTGYCTWYSNKNGGAGSEESTAEFAKIAREKLVPYGMNFFQIDDKWQKGNSKNGPNKNFTDVRPDGPYKSGLKKTADFLAENGLRCGIWFMPFSGNFDDPYFADKQDLFVKSAIDYPAPGEKNTRTYSSINQKKDAPYETFWGGTCLDATNPKTIASIENVTRRIAHEWNCGYFKVDGLWTGLGIEQLYVNDAYKPDDIGEQIFYDSKATNVEAYVAGLSAVRRAAGDSVFILGCNVSQNMRMMLPSVGLVDAMRIGPDNGADWKGICAGPWRGSNRYFLNGRVWWNDPDPVYVRDSIPLSHARVITSWAALTGQLFAFSDWLPELSEERVNVLRKTMPGHGLKTARPADLFTSDMARVWTLTDRKPNEKPSETRFIVGLFNWNEKEPAEFSLSPEKLGLPNAAPNGEKISDFAVYNFWEEKTEENFGPGASQKTLNISLPGGSCAILAVRANLNRPALLSTSRNITQGIYEVVSEEWNAEKKSLVVTVDSKKAALAEELPYTLRVAAPKNFGQPVVSLESNDKRIAESLPVQSENGAAVVTVGPLPEAQLGDKATFVFQYGE